MKIPYKQAIRAMTMTANEMADRNEWACCAYSKEVSAMLRQQAKEIEALKQRLELAEWDEALWKKYKRDNYEVIELKPRSEK
jgi:hypothetical protein